MSLTTSARLPDGFISSTDLVGLTGLSYRQLDYLARTEVIVPAVAARGSGQWRQWSAEQVPLCQALAYLLALSAPHEALRAVVANLAAVPGWWGHRVVVTDIGDHEWVIVDVDDPQVSAGWLLDLPAIAAMHVESLAATA